MHKKSVQFDFLVKTAQKQKDILKVNITHLNLHTRNVHQVKNCTCLYKNCMIVCIYDNNNHNVTEKPQSCQALRCGPNSSGWEAGPKDCWEV